MRGNIDERGKKLFIGGLHLKTTEDSLKAFYSQWGDLIDVVVMRDPHTGKSRGFGFVTYNDPASVDLAQGNRPHEIDGIKVDAKRAMPKEDTSPEFHATVNRLFVGRLKKNITAEAMKEYFSEYGTIADSVVINNPDGESRGFGFVTFDDPDSVDKIIVSRPHQIDGQTIEVKKALPRDENNKGSSKPQNTSGGRAPRGDFNNVGSRNDYRNAAPRGDYNSNPRGGYNNNSAPRGSYNAAPRGGGAGYNGYSNTSFNSRYQDDSNNASFGSYPNSNNGSYRMNNDYSNGNSGAAYSQNYSAPTKQTLGGNPVYSDHQFDNTAYSSQEPIYGNQQQPPQLYNSEPDYGYGQYEAPPAQQQQAPRSYGYPPYGGAGNVPDYGQKPAGGPMRGSAAGFGRGGARYGTQPY